MAGAKPRAVGRVVGHEAKELVVFVGCGSVWVTVGIRGWLSWRKGCGLLGFDRGGDSAAERLGPGRDS